MATNKLVSAIQNVRLAAAACIIQPWQVAAIVATQHIADIL